MIDKTDNKLCLHTITTKPLNISEAVKLYKKEGITGITIWQDALENRSVSGTSQMIRDAGLEIVSLCRGGFFAHKDKDKRLKSINDNLKTIDMAAELGSPLVVLVCGADPSQPLDDSRSQIKDGIENIIHHAGNCNIRLAIEPLHPMYADSRSAINTLKQANDLLEEFSSDVLGVAIDVYHVWWDPELEPEIKRSGHLKSIFAFHISDWKVPTKDLLLDRGIMGEGCINLRKIRKWVKNAGFNGFDEVEIFSNDYWKTNQEIFLKKIKEAYLKNVIS